MEPRDKPRRQSSKWVAVIALIGAVLALAAMIVGPATWRHHEWKRERIAETAFHAGSVRGPDYLLPYFRRLPAVAPLAEGLRFVAQPQLDGMTYSAVLHRLPAAERATGLLIIDIEPHNRVHGRNLYRCSLPADAYVAMREGVSERLHDFRGSDDRAFDGTRLAIEQVYGGSVMSGSGNMIEPYRGVGEVVLAQLRNYCSNAPLPEVGADWYGCGTSEEVRCSIGGPPLRLKTAITAH